MAGFTHLLDTSVYSQFLKPKPAQPALDRWHRHGDAVLAVSAICEAEVLYGIALNPPNAAALQQRYNNLLRRRLAILPIDGDVAAAFASLKAACKQRGTLVPEMDLLIASTALTHNLIVATLNHRHFKLCPGLALEDWSQPPPLAVTP
ncbi:MAG: type II toxin-antitoxin system VapC family toxin [Opitutaceae bacterium]